MTDYKTKLHEAITQLQQAVKLAFKKAADETVACSLDTLCYRPNGKRTQAMESLTEDYFAEAGEMPDSVALERLADLCLWEELTDTNPDKMTDEEYPFMGEHQFDRRDNRESSVGIAIDNSAADGRKHTKPTKRTRTDYENRFVDKKAKIRNKERKKTYTEFMKVQPVNTYKIR